jgi:hypothetical protein
MNVRFNLQPGPWTSRPVEVIGYIRDSLLHCIPWNWTLDFEHYPGSGSGSSTVEVIGYTRDSLLHCTP